MNPSIGWNVWGQDNAVRELQRAIQTTPAHAYLFSGPSHSGKRLAALNFAMALCCGGGQEAGRYCSECSACRRIGRSVYPDVTVYDLASQAERDREKSRNLSLNIQTVREVSSAIAFRPAESKWRIVIVGDAETMQETAQEAFLKTLEEPPSYAIIILVASDAERLLDTIRSRCTSIRFGSATIPVVTEALRAHGAAVGDAETIAALSGGSIGWALRALEDPALLEHRSLIVQQAMDLVAADSYQRMVRAVSLADGFAADRDGVRERLQAIQDIWRSVMYVRAGVHDRPGFGAINERVEEIALGAIVDAVESVEKCLDNLEANVRPRLALEAMVSSWPTVSS